MSAKTITVFSNKGGVGKTFTCVNVATALALAKNKVLLIDMDFYSGQDMARMLNLVPQHSVVEMIPELEKTDNNDVFKRFVIPHQSGVDYITAITNTRQIGHITPDNIKPFFKRAAQVYDFIIIDVGKTFTEVLIAILDMSNLVLMVATPDILAVYQVKWGMDVLASQHFPLKMIKVILNRAESYGGVAWQEVQQALGCEILGRIPSDGRTVGIALNKGIPCVMDSPRSRVAGAFIELADVLKDQAHYIQTTEILKGRSSFSSDETGVDFWGKLGIVEGVLPAQAKVSSKKEENEIDRIKKRAHEKLLERMNLKAITPDSMSDPVKSAQIRQQVERLVNEILVEETSELVSSHQNRGKLVVDIVNATLGLGPLEDFLADIEVTDIMVNSKDDIYVEKKGKIIKTDRKFLSNQQLRSIIERIIAPLGRRIDESVPMVDARLPDGSRINAIIPPLSLRGPMVTIRKFAKDRYTADDLIHRFHSLSQPMADFIQAVVASRKNMIISGGTGSGKTTMLNIISHYIPDGERIITIEDAAELKLNKAHWVRLESRPPNVEGKGAITIRDLFINTLRMRPDRIIIGECRGGEVLDMLQAMNTGHDGSLTTVHANSTHDVITRLNSMILLSGVELPLRAVYDMIASAIDIVVQVSRFSDGARRVTAITEVTGNVVDGMPEVKDIFVFQQKGIDPNGKVLGEFTPTGYVPICFKDLVLRGCHLKEDIFLPNQVYPIA